MIASPVNDSMRKTSQTALRIIPALPVFILLLASTNSSAQSLGDLARQERNRVRNNSAESTRVFTNEDLARPKILEEQKNSDSLARIEVPPAMPAPASTSVSEPSVNTMVVPVWPEGTPLGDIARFYRQWKELQSQPIEAPILAHDSPIQTAPVRAPLVLHPIQEPFSPDPSALTQQQFIAPPEPAVPEYAPAQGVVPSVIQVSRGDSLWKLASRYLGDGNQWTEIASVNPGIADPNLIHVGQQIRLPGTAIVASPTVVTTVDQVRVRPGDSLWKLAESRWGTGLAWSCIAESNPQIEDSSKIYPGQTLALPATCSSSV